jgi:hypothetical protein
VLFAAGNELVRGPAAIGAALAGGPPVDWTWHPVVAGASPDGSFGFTIGESISRLRGQPDSPPNASKYLTVWRKEASGAVRYAFDGGNPRPLKSQK